jgi:hypothetical protein
MRSGCESMPKLEPVTNLLGRRSRKGDCLPKGVGGPESDAIFRRLSRVSWNLRWRSPA